MTRSMCLGPHCALSNTCSSPRCCLRRQATCPPSSQGSLRSSIQVRCPARHLRRLGDAKCQLPQSHTHTHTHTHTRTHTCIHTHTYTHTHLLVSHIHWSCLCALPCLDLAGRDLDAMQAVATAALDRSLADFQKAMSTFEQVCAHVCMCVCVHVCMRAYVYVCMSFISFPFPSPPPPLSLCRCRCWFPW